MTNPSDKKSSGVQDDEIIALVRAVKDRDSGAFDELYKRFRPLIRRLINSFTKTSALEKAEKEDLIQESSCRLYKAAMTYDVDQTNVTFGLYAKICIKNYLITELRKMKKKQKQQRPGSRFSAPSAVPQSHSEPYPIEARKALLKMGDSVLSKRESAVLDLYMQQRRYEDIARELSISVKSVDNALFRAKKKLKELRKAQAANGEQR